METGTIVSSCTRPTRVTYAIFVVVVLFLWSPVCQSFSRGMMENSTKEHCNKVTGWGNRYAVYEDKGSFTLSYGGTVSRTN